MSLMEHNIRIVKRKCTGTGSLKEQHKLDMTLPREEKMNGQLLNSWS